MITWYKRRKLLAAIVGGDIQTATQLLERGLDPNFGRQTVAHPFFVKPKHMPPLYAAVAFSDQRMVEVLLEHGADPHRQLRSDNGAVLPMYANTLAFVVAQASALDLMAARNNVFSQKYFDMYVLVRGKMDLTGPVFHHMTIINHPTLNACCDWEQRQRIAEQLEHTGVPRPRKM